METTIKNITTELVESYSYSLSENERVNNLLDKINDMKKDYIQLSENINKLSLLLSKITWLDNLSDNDEVMIKAIVVMGKEADNRFKKFYASHNRIFSPKGLFRNEFVSLKNSIAIHIETVFDVERIIFELRKSKEFKSLDNLIKEL